jgi:hypothetical protein
MALSGTAFPVMMFENYVRLFCPSRVIHATPAAMSGCGTNVTLCSVVPSTTKSSVRRRVGL